MDTGYIREFVTLAGCLSYSEAAERLFISQPSLTKHIQALEREMGTALFARTTRSIRLSGAGSLFLPFARQIVDLCDRWEIAVDDLINRSGTSLTIAVMQNPQYYDMTKYIVSFRQTHPDVNFSIVEADEYGLYEMFRKGSVNIIPTFSGFWGMEGHPFMAMAASTIVAIVRRDHPRAESGRVSLRELGGERLLLPSRGGWLSELILAAFRRQAVTPRVVYEGSSIGCIDLVKAGMGVSLHAGEFAAGLQGDREVVALATEPEVTFAYGLGHRPLEELSCAERLYLSHMKQFELCF